MNSISDIPGRRMVGVSVTGAPRRLHGMAWATLLTGTAFLAPLTAQTEAGAPAESKTVGIQVVGSDGQETVTQQTLAKGEGLLVRQVNGKIVDKEVVRPGENPRVIIKFKGDALAQQFKQGLQKGLQKNSVLGARQKMEKSREGFKDRLHDMENRHRSKKGQTAISREALVAREYNFCINGIAARVNPDLVEEIRQMPEVEAVYPDRRMQVLGGNGAAQIGAPKVWQQLGSSGWGVLIAILDSGIDYNHPDLGGGFGPGRKVEDGYDFVNEDADPMDDNGHGTHVAGIAAANGLIMGVAPNARLAAVKVMDQSGYGMESDIIAGIEWAVAHGANIINMSIGDMHGDPDDAICFAVDQATYAGVLVVVAAGNFGSGGYGTTGSPAIARTALAVGADDAKSQLASFSSRGPAKKTYQIKPEVVAPGVDIYSTVPTSGTQYCDPSGYATMSGTSMAAPHVAGAAALLRQLHWDWSAIQLKQALLDGAVGIGKDTMSQGNGEINVYTSATLPVTTAGDDLSLGWDDLREQTSFNYRFLQYTNTSNTALNINFSFEGAAPAGMTLMAIPESMEIQPGESQPVFFYMQVENTITPNLSAPPFVYDGSVVANLSDGSRIRRPFAIVKAPKVKIMPDLQGGYLIDAFYWTMTDEYTYALDNPFEKVVPEGTYDFIFVFIPFDQSSPAPRQVVREKINVSTYTEIAVSCAEAKNKLEFKTTDSLGQPLTPDFTSAQVSFKNKLKPLVLGFSLLNFPLQNAGCFYVSDCSDKFRWDATLSAEFLNPTTPTYCFNASLHNGITSPQVFNITPKDLIKTTIVHGVRPGQRLQKLTTYSGNIEPGLVSVRNYTEKPPVQTPFEQTVYSNVPSTPDATGGYWATDGVGETPSGNLPAWTSDALYRSPNFRPASREILVGKDTGGLEVYRSVAKKLRLGQGLAHWTGSLANQPEKIRVQGVEDSVYDRKLFHGQYQEELVHGLLPYTLTQNGKPIASGTLDQAMDYNLATFTAYAVEMPVTPGAYELTIPFTGFLMRGKPGSLEVVNKFDTTRTDPNPPFLTSFQLLNPLDLLQRDPFIDTVPVTGAELRFGVDDDVKVKDAKITVQYGNIWLPMPVRKIANKQYAVYVPWPGCGRDAIKVKLVASDTAGNSVTHTETIPCVKL